MSQIEENLLITSPKSQPGDLNNLHSLTSMRKTIMKKSVKNRRISKKYFGNRQIQNPLEINISQFTNQMSLISSSPMDTPNQYLKVNKLMRITNQVSEGSQSNKKKVKPRFVFTPEQRFIMMFNLATIVVIYMYFSQIPISIAFCNLFCLQVFLENHRKQADTQKIFQYINIPALLIFIFGALIKSRTSYFQYGTLVTDTKLIAINYFKNSFVIDLLSIGSIVVYQISQVFHKGPITYRFIILLFYLKIGDLTDLEKYFISQYDLNRRVKAFLKMFLLLTKIYMMVNLVACGFFYLSDNLCRAGGVYQFKDCCWTTSLKFDGKTITQLQWNVQYAYSIYWASTTMISIGYGDITPQNPYQISYTICIQFASCIIYAYSLNHIWEIIQQLNSKKAQIQHRISVMNTYMRDKKISPQLKSKIKAYLLHFFHTRNIRQKDLQNDLIQQLTPSLKTQLLYEAYGFIFRNHSFFKNFSSQSLQISSQKIIQSGFFQEQLIFSSQQGQQNMLFYVQQGEVQNYIQLRKNKISVRKIYFDQTIGLYEFITQLNYKSNLIANKYSVVYKLKFDDWKNCLMNEDEDFQKLYAIRESIIFDKNYQQLDHVCEFCRQKTHLTEQCFQKQIDHAVSKFIKRYKTKQERQPFQRYNIKSSHILSRISIIHGNTSAFKSSLYYKQDTKNRKKHRKQSVDIHSFKNHFSLQNSHIRHKKIINRNQSIHHDIVKQIKNKIQQAQGQDFDDLYSQDSQMLSTQNMIDKVQNYDYYYPKYNAEQQSKKQKQMNLRKFRMTKMF